MKRFVKLAGAAAVVAFLAGCATVSPDGGMGDVQKLAQGKTAGVDATLGSGPTAQTGKAVADLLAQPVDEEREWRYSAGRHPRS